MLTRHSRLRRKCRAVELKLNSVVLDLKHRPGILGSAQSDRTSTDRQNHTPHPHPTAGHRRNRHGLAAVDSTPSSPPATAPNRIRGAIALTCKRSACDERNAPADPAKRYLTGTPPLCFAPDGAAAQRGCVYPVLRQTCWLRLVGDMPAGRSGCRLTARRRLRLALFNETNYFSVCDCIVLPIIVCFRKFAFRLLKISIVEKKLIQRPVPKIRPNIQ